MHFLLRQTMPPTPRLCVARRYEAHCARMGLAGTFFEEPEFQVRRFWERKEGERKFKGE